MAEPLVHCPVCGGSLELPGARCAWVDSPDSKEKVWASFRPLYFSRRSILRLTTQPSTLIQVGLFPNLRAVEIILSGGRRESGSCADIGCRAW